MITLNDDKAHIVAFHEAEVELSDQMRRPVAYHRIFAKIGGGACAGVFLSQAWYWTPKTKKHPNGWFYKTAEDWEKETGLSSSELRRARRELLKRGLIEEYQGGHKNQLHYRVCIDRVVALATGAETYTPEMTEGKLKRIENLRNVGANRCVENSAAETTEKSAGRSNVRLVAKYVEDTPTELVDNSSAYNREYTESTSKSTPETTTKEYEHFAVSNETAQAPDEGNEQLREEFNRIAAMLVEELTKRGGAKPSDGDEEHTAWLNLTKMVMSDYCTPRDVAGCMDWIFDSYGFVCFRVVVRYIDDYLSHVAGGVAVA